MTQDYFTVEYLVWYFWIGLAVIKFYCFWALALSPVTNPPR